MSSLAEGDRAAAAVSTHPRVTRADLEANIAERIDFNAGEMARGWIGLGSAARPLNTVSICILITRNGFTLIGKSAPASEENFDCGLGRKLAYEDAVRQLWPLMRYALRTQLATVEQPAP